MKVAVTHGLFCDPAIEKFTKSGIDEIVVTDTVPLSRKVLNFIKNYDEKSPKYPKIKVLSVSSLIGEAISRIYYNRSISVLLNCDYENRM